MQLTIPPAAERTISRRLPFRTLAVDQLPRCAGVDQAEYHRQLERGINQAS
jgi:hypothetical protein